MAKPTSPPPPPIWLAGSLRSRWNELAPTFYRMGTLTDLEVGILARYIVAENNYLQVSNLLQQAISSGDGDATNKWLAAQDRLTKQTLTLGEALGLTAEKRKAMGWSLP